MLPGREARPPPSSPAPRCLRCPGSPWLGEAGLPAAASRTPTWRPVRRAGTGWTGFTWLRRDNHQGRCGSTCQFDVPRGRPCLFSRLVHRHTYLAALPEAAKPSSGGSAALHGCMFALPSQRNAFAMVAPEVTAHREAFFSSGGDDLRRRGRVTFAAGQAKAE